METPAPKPFVPKPSRKKAAVMDGAAKSKIPMTAARTSRSQLRAASAPSVLTLKMVESPAQAEGTPVPGLLSLSSVPEGKGKESIVAKKVERAALVGNLLRAVNSANSRATKTGEVVSDVPSGQPTKDLRAQVESVVDEDEVIVPSVEIASSAISAKTDHILSATPSLTSLVNPAPSEATVSARSSLAAQDYSESIISALLAGRGHLRDPTRDDDPLLPYGVEDGGLPGKTPELTQLLCNVIMHWTLPHNAWDWTSLLEGVQEFQAVRITNADLIGYEASGAILHSLNAHTLDRVAQLALAVHQILNGLYQFLGTPRSEQFLLAPKWQLLRLMEENMSRSTILMAFSSMQFRLQQASKHVQRQLVSVRRVYGAKGLDSVSTVDSTRSSVRTEFGKSTPHVELGKLLARPNHGARAYNADARASLVANTTDGLRTEFYKVREEALAMPTFVIQALPVIVEPTPAPFESVPYMKETPERSTLVETPYSIPPSLASVGPASISVLLGVGKLPTNWGGTPLTAPPTIGVNVNGLDSGVARLVGTQVQDARSASIALQGLAAANAATGLSDPTSIVAANAASSAIPPTSSHWTSYNFRNVPTLSGPSGPTAVGSAPVGNPVTQGIAAGVHVAPPQQLMNGGGPGDNPGAGPPGGGGGLPYGFPGGAGFGGAGNNGGTGPGGPGGAGLPGGGGGPPFGGNGGGRGGDGGGGPPGGGEPPFDGPQGNYDWQINRKLNIQLVPEWDGHGKTAINYICKVAELVRLSPQMIVDLGAIAPLKFTGRAEMWWRTQSTAVRAFLGQSWPHMLQAIQAHFLNANWLQVCRCEWEEIGVFLYPEEDDRVIVVDHILPTAPDIWAGVINSERYPSIFALTAAVRHYRPTLMANWISAQKGGGLNNYYPRRSHHNAHLADASDSEEEEEDHGASGGTRAVYASSNGYRNNRCAPANGAPAQNRAPPTQRQNWPEGKTVKGYEFVKRDDVRSERAPKNGVCYICTSPHHFA
ncbi:hypothetical protein B0H16DRAFT_1741194 [Mycena metata]|uniref:Uncharacterized protein n=1 Tax=Mycena metata TaxID=1033252 RepID=A0AAD7MGN3_9AGAR|nr:hypothetical protein B0H16DRAFT_1741194 [Mycena metata]